MKGRVDKTQKTDFISELLNGTMARLLMTSNVSNLVLSMAMEMEDKIP